MALAGLLDRSWEAPGGSWGAPGGYWKAFWGQFGFKNPKVTQDQTFDQMFDLFFNHFWSILEPTWAPKSIKNRSKIDQTCD